MDNNESFNNWDRPKNIFEDDSDNVFADGARRRRESGFGGYGDFENGIVKEARGTFSRYALGLLLYSVAAYVVIIAVELILALNTPQWFYQDLAEQVWFQWLMGVAPMYVIGFPVFYLIIRKMEVTPRKKTKLGAKDFFALLLVAEAFMYVGNIMGTWINGVVGALRGEDVGNATSELIENSPVWLIFLVVVIVAPIVEELLFRKLMIDRISKYGDKLAIIVSAVAFGLFHGNFYQFFYAALLGLVLGYIYTKTGDVRYTMLMHAVINFFGSIVALPVVDMQETLLAGGIPETAEAIKEYMLALMGVGSYAMIQYAMVIAGIAILVYAIRNRLIYVNRNAPIRIPEHRTAGAVLGNVGTILFLVLSLMTFGLNLFV